MKFHYKSADQKSLERANKNSAKADRMRRWLPSFAWLPTQIDSCTTVWLEHYARRLTNEGYDRVRFGRSVGRDHFQKGPITKLLENSQR